MKKLLYGLVGFVLAVTLDVTLYAQGSLSNQVLRLLARTNTWTALQTFDGSSGVILLTRQTGALGTRTDRLENIGGNLYFNGEVLATNASSGTVTSIGVSMPAIFSVASSPVTSSGTIAVTLATETANFVFSGPTTGSAAAPTFRALVAADIPSLAASKITSGTVAVANGGTGLTAGTSGGILYYSATGTLASSGALTASRIVLGGGAGVTPTVVASLGTSTTVLHGNGGGAPTFGSVALTTDVTGTLPAANGGTGMTSFTSGGVPYFNSASTIASSGALTANRIVLGGGAGAAPTILGSLGTTITLLHGNASGAPTFAAVNLGTEVSGALGVTNGGTSMITVAQGDIMYGLNTSAWAALSKSTSSTRYLSNTGSSNNPAWAQVALTTGVSGILPAANGGTGINGATVTNGQLLIGKTSDSTLNLATLTGTSNQITVTNGAASITLSTPQSIGTSSTPQFARLGLGTSAGATALVTGAGVVDLGYVNDGNSSTADTIDWSTGPVHKTTMTGDATYTFTNPIAGQVYWLVVVQDATGTRIATWPGAVTWTGGSSPTLTATANKTDICRFLYTGSVYLGKCDLNF